MGFDLRRIRADFPILQRRIATADGKRMPLVYMDHGSSTHAPTPVLQAVQKLCSESYANVHRGNHTLSQESSQLFEDAVETLGRFVGANPETQPVVLGSNTTSSLDLAAHLVDHKRGRTLTTLSEHHSNDLPHRRRGDVLHAEVDEDGHILLDDVEAKLHKRFARKPVKLLAVTGASNVTGIMPPVHKLARLAHDHGARILVDAAQLYAHAPIDVKSADHPEHIDFLAAAGHKSYAPFGASFLVAPRDVLDAAPPYMPGGGTVQWVTQDSVLFSKGPDRHQGGTPNIVGTVAFAAATRYLAAAGMENVRDHEEKLVYQALRRFAELEETHGVHLLGPRDSGAAGEKVGVFAFLIPGRTHGESSRLLDRQYGIATRNGCFCAHPLLHRLLKLGDTPQWTDKITRGEPVELPGATRATFGIYNTEAEVDFLAKAVAAIAHGDMAHSAPHAAMVAEVS
ncbi:MAG: aminotransferase class V-fold PLP-dependent enzyme [bacterium]